MKNTKAIMTRAWEIYRVLIGDHVAKLSQALKKAWAEAKSESEVSITFAIAKLIKMGASRWTNYGKDRLYLGKCGAEIIGLELNCYKSGGISSAYLDGEKISNANAGRWISAYADAYIDLKSMTLYRSTSRFTKLFLEKLQAYIPVKANEEIY